MSIKWMIIITAICTIISFVLSIYKGYELLGWGSASIYALASLIMLKSGRINIDGEDNSDQ